MVFIQIRSKKAPTDYTDSTDKRFCIRIKARRLRGLRRFGFYSDKK